MDAKVGVLQKEVYDLKQYVLENRAFKQSDNIITLEQIMEQHKISFPMETLDQFNKVETCLTKQLYSDLVII